jgi:protein translocase SEC61 complex gamma subunit
MFNLSKFFSRSKMILYKITKPKNSDFWMTARVTSTGVILIGMIGLVILGIFSLIRMIMVYIIG